MNDLPLILLIIVSVINIGVDCYYLGYIKGLEQKETSNNQ